MKALKAFFLSRLLREKLLLMGFIGLAAALWASGFGKRAGNFTREQRVLRTTLDGQAIWLGRRTSIEEKSQQAIARLDPSRTLSDTRLLGEVNAIASRLGLRMSSDDAHTQTTAQFAVHSLRLSVTDVSYEKLKAFYNELQKQSPYIGLDEFTVQAKSGSQANSQDLVTASLRISSVEIVAAGRQRTASAR